jgi:hypothetical protein
MGHQVVGISAYTYDILGARTVYMIPSALELSDTGQRRATRTKTLDGGAVVYDAGFAVADQTLVIRARENTSRISAFFALMVKTYNLVKISTSEGVFAAVPSRWSVKDGIAQLDALVIAQLA